MVKYKRKTRELEWKHIFYNKQTKIHYNVSFPYNKLMDFIKIMYVALEGNFKVFSFLFNTFA